jgi:hypothetical protein
MTNPLIDGKLFVHSNGALLTKEQLCYNGGQVYTKITSKLSEAAKEERTDVSTMKSIIQGVAHETSRKEETRSGLFKCSVSEKILEQLVRIRDTTRAPQEFRAHVLRIGGLKVIGPHFFNWNGSPRDNNDVVWAICHLPSNPHRLKRILLTTLAVGATLAAILAASRNKTLGDGLKDIGLRGWDAQANIDRQGKLVDDAKNKVVSGYNIITLKETRQNLQNTLNHWMTPTPTVADATSQLLSASDEADMAKDALKNAEANAQKTAQIAATASGEAALDAQVTAIEAEHEVKIAQTKYKKAHAAVDSAADKLQAAKTKQFNEQFGGAPTEKQIAQLEKAKEAILSASNKLKKTKEALMTEQKKIGTNTPTKKELAPLLKAEAAFKLADKQFSTIWQNTWTPEPGVKYLKINEIAAVNTKNDANATSKASYLLDLTEAAAQNSISDAAASFHRHRSSRYGVHNR